MEQTQHGIEYLPDGILHCILSLLPMKSAVRTSILSKTLRDVWLSFWVHATTLDFRDEFTFAQTPEQFIHIVNRFIRLHKGKKIERFGIHFHLENQYQVEADKWVEFATSRGVRELDLDFGHGECESKIEDRAETCIELPSSFFICESVTCLKLGFCDFNPPIEYASFSSLKTLQLSQSPITDDELESVLLNCPRLECLTLMECFDLVSIKISGPNLQLRSLTVVLCSSASELEILAPHLQSFYFHGAILDGYLLEDVPALVDAFVESAYFEHTEHDCMGILLGLSHIKILTICSGLLTYVDTFAECYGDELPITFPYLEELQIEIEISDIYHRGSICGFLKNMKCPCLDKLFIKLSSSGSGDIRVSDLKKRVEDDSGCVLYSLRTIKITNFGGSKAEMRLVNLFLDKAVRLESLVIVSPQSSYQKVSRARFPSQSREARILCYENGKDESGLFPTHPKYGVYGF